MMYQIEWNQKALNELAEIWLAATDRNAVTDASAAVEIFLRRSPLDFGESRNSSVHRLAFHPPLSLEFDVIEDDKKVIVLHIGVSG